MAVFCNTSRKQQTCQKSGKIILMNDAKKHRLSISTENNFAVFVLFTALNALGYDDENNPRGMTPIRKIIRRTLLKKHLRQDFPVLEKYFKEYHQYTLLEIVLRRSARNQHQALFANELKKFGKKSIVKKLWTLYKSKQNQISKKTFVIFKTETQNLIKFIGQKPKSIDNIILMTTSLDAYWRGYAIKINRNAYIVVGPGAEDNNKSLIKHELLHILTPKWHLPKSIMKNDGRKRLSALGYGTAEAIQNEYIVRGLSLLYESEIFKKDISKQIKRERLNFPKIEESIKYLKKKAGLP